MDRKISDLTTNVNAAINRFNASIDTINAQNKGEASAITHVNEAMAAMSQEISSSLMALRAEYSELSEKANKMLEYFYSNLPAINQSIADINQLKTNYGEMKIRVDGTSGEINALSVQLSAMQMKMDGLGKEFQNIQKGIADAQNNILEFLNIAKSATCTLFSPSSKVLCRFWTSS